MLDRSNAQPKYPPFPGSLPSNYHGPLKSETLSPISLPSPLSSSRSNSIAMESIMNDMGYPAVHELEETHLGATPWAGGNALPQAPAALPSMGYSSATDLDGLHGDILF